MQGAGRQLQVSLLADLSSWGKTGCCPPLPPPPRPALARPVQLWPKARCPPEDALQKELGCPAWAGPSSSLCPRVWLCVNLRLRSAPQASSRPVVTMGCVSWGPCIILVGAEKQVATVALRL